MFLFRQIRDGVRETRNFVIYERTVMAVYTCGRTDCDDGWEKKQKLLA